MELDLLVINLHLLLLINHKGCLQMLIKDPYTTLWPTFLLASSRAQSVKPQTVQAQTRSKIAKIYGIFMVSMWVVSVPHSFSFRQIITANREAGNSRGLKMKERAGDQMLVFDSYVLGPSIGFTHTAYQNKQSNAISCLVPASDQICPTFRASSSCIE